MAGEVLIPITVPDTSEKEKEAWRIINDNFLLFSRRVNDIREWIDASKIEANTITANEIAALTITAAEIVAGTITAAKLTITDLVDIVNLLTVASGKIVIGAGAIGAGLDGILINDGTYDRVKLGEYLADTYGLSLADSAGVETVIGGTVQDVWKKIYDNVLTAATTTISLTSGLDGNNDQMYCIVWHVINNTDGAESFYIRVNNDSGANYAWESIFSSAGTPTGQSSDGQTAWKTYSALAQNDIAQITMFLQAKIGQVRVATAHSTERVAGAAVGVSSASGYAWNNAVSNITRFDFYAGNANGIKAGSHLTIYKIPSY